ncbi:helix-turn-helix domain-containing protein [Qipengyuania flava]|uniref:helix-turn-helix domain-containing protein n=1 Tax=Qipengyuania flava TaxID=192812 RepID=UPI001CD5D290|nr:helix-turn-helix domain-containing protein [Qipengyuania flava]MCA0888839.1 helix-turn-helix domain-containing protein [Qipengyuania flava]
MSTGQTSGAVALRFFLPPKRLRPFVTTLYHLEIFGEGDELVEDWLHPEWANLRIIPQRTIDAGMAGGPLENLPRAVIVGPTSVTAHFRARPGRSWGIGLMPRGWARLSQAPADEYADRWADAETDPAFAHLAALCGAVPLESGGLAAERDALLRELTLLLAEPAAREAEILRFEEALTDPRFHSVAELADALGMSPRTMERFCRRAFGFSPQLLLRRQRFVRSLAKFMLDPSLRWIDTLDGHYHDQAHFVRDFKRFMTMSPSDYAKLPHPVLAAAAHARMAAAGQAMQVLHQPIDE